MPSLPQGLMLKSASQSDHLVGSVPENARTFTLSASATKALAVFVDSLPGAVPLQVPMRVHCQFPRIVFTCACSAGVLPTSYASWTAQAMARALVELKTVPVTATGSLAL